MNMARCNIMDFVLFCLILTHLLGLACALVEMVQYKMARYENDTQLLVPVSTFRHLDYETIVSACRYAGVMLLAIATLKLPSLYHQRVAVMTLPISSVFRGTVLYLLPLFMGCVALVTRLIVLLLNSSCKDGAPYHVTIGDVSLEISCYFPLFLTFLWIVYMLLIMYKKIERYELEEMQTSAPIKVPEIVSKQSGYEWERSNKFQCPVKDKTLLISEVGGRIYWIGG